MENNMTIHRDHPHEPITLRYEPKRLTYRIAPILRNFRLKGQVMNETSFLELVLLPEKTWIFKDNYGNPTVGEITDEQKDLLLDLGLLLEINEI